MKLLPLIPRAEFGALPMNDFGLDAEEKEIMEKLRANTEEIDI